MKFLAVIILTFAVVAMVSSYSAVDHTTDSAFTGYSYGIGNSGTGNAGNYNSGNNNAGDRNSGDGNVGNNNSGDNHRGNDHSEK